MCNETFCPEEIALQLKELDTLAGISYTYISDEDYTRVLELMKEVIERMEAMIKTFDDMKLGVCGVRAKVKEALTKRCITFKRFNWILIMNENELGNTRQNFLWGECQLPMHNTMKFLQKRLSCPTETFTFPPDYSLLTYFPNNPQGYIRY